MNKRKQKEQTANADVPSYSGTGTAKKLFSF